jgi:hypothetical protein
MIFRRRSSLTGVHSGKINVIRSFHIDTGTLALSALAAFAEIDSGSAHEPGRNHLSEGSQECFGAMMGACLTDFAPGSGSSGASLNHFKTNLDNGDTYRGIPLAPCRKIEGVT